MSVKTCDSSTNLLRLLSASSGIDYVVPIRLGGMGGTTR